MTILAVNLNAAIDKRYDIDDIQIGCVQRVKHVAASAGGKGLNVARAARIAGQAVIVTGFVGGFAGEFVTSQATGLEVRDEFIRVDGESRTCINIIDAAGRSTELLEPGVTVKPCDLEALLNRVRSLLPEVDVVTMSGSAPQGCPDDVYASLVRAARKSSVPVILDTSGNLLVEGLKAKPDVFKPNREELSVLVGEDLPDLDAVVSAARKVAAKGPHWVVVSLGADGAVAVSRDRAVHAGSLHVPVNNPVGCGDVLVAGLASGIARGLDVPSALPFAVQASAASVAHTETGQFDYGLARSLERDLAITDIDVPADSTVIPGIGPSRGEANS